MFHLKNKDKRTDVKSSSIFARIREPFLLLAIFNAIVLLAILYVVRVPFQLNQNSYDICQKQVDNRQRYLQAQTTDNWGNLEELADYINVYTETMRNTEKIDLEKLDSSTAECTPLLLSVVDRMIQELYAKQVSGIYLIFNTQDLQEDIKNKDWKEKTGIYICDKDPLSASSTKYADLLLECSPSKVVQQLSLSTDRKWEQKFKFSEDNPYEDWLVQPYCTAISDPSLEASDCGLWSLKYNLDGNYSLTYSMPLILSDGQVYGILGIELFPAYLDNLLPYQELDESGFYGLFLSDRVSEDGQYTGTFYPVSTHNSPFPSKTASIDLKMNANHWLYMKENNVVYETAITPLVMYSRNTPFYDQQWYVLGAVPEKNLFSFARRVTLMLLFSIFLILIFGTLGSFAVSWHIARPVLGLRQELAEAQPGSIPDLSKTGISEIDDFAMEITNLSKSVVNSSKRFLSIMEMSSIDMGGYEVDEQNGFLFVTENYFEMFNQPELNVHAITPQQFMEIRKEIRSQLEYEQIGMNSILYTVRDENGSIRYIHVQEQQIENRQIGVAEDVTLQVLERKHIERERDYDMLTGIYNRRAFFHAATKQMEKLDAPISIAIMIDLDNLKEINDTYGHEWGDQYIMDAAKCIQKYSAKNAICARISGDEFNIFMSGFQDETEARQAVEKLWKGFWETTLHFPDGIIRSISASGGYVVIRDGMADILQLIKYADFAMYQIKKENKGSFGRFDMNQYLANELEKERHNTFRRIVRKEEIRYVFQPIISAKTGKIFAFEALMRIMDTEDMNLAEFLRIAKKENALGDVERLTWFHALPAFQKLVQNHIAPDDTRLFVNSQVSHVLGYDEQKKLIEKYRDIRDKVVMEVLETDDYAIDFSRLHDQDHEIFAREFALDDYGTGYNSELNLINLMPKYIKIDMSLIRDVEKYQERQKLIAGLLSFAHDKDMLVLAEGVETIAELHCLLSLGVDLYQGYLFSRPMEVPGDLNQEAMELLRNHRMDA